MINSNRQNALVTGGAGFIGSHLVDRLVKDGFEVTVLDNFDPFYDPAIKRRNLNGAAASGAVRLVEADIRDLASLRRQLHGPYDVIVHLAAKAGVRPSIADPQGFQTTNVNGTQNLLDLAHVLGVKQFVFASSSSVYGVNPNVPWHEGDNNLQPISPYASTKASGELLGHVYSHLYGIRFLALRLFTVYGPRQRPDLAIHKFASLMLAGHPVPQFGDGSSRRDYTYIDDIVCGIRAAMDYKGSMYEKINLGNHHTVSLAEMIAELEKALGIRASLDRQPEQPGDVPETWADLTKARTLLGYTPHATFSEGLQSFAEWLRADRAVSTAEAAMVQ